MNIAIQLISPGYRIPFFDKMVETHLAMEDTLVVLAREDTKLMGLAVFVMEQTYKVPVSPKNIIIPEKLKKIFDFIECMKSRGDVSLMYNLDTSTADVEFLVCDSQYRIPGLGTEIIRRGIEILNQEKNVKVITAHASSYYSRRIFENN